MKKVLISALLLVIISSCSSSAYTFRKKSSDYLEINKGIIQQASKMAEYRVETSAKIKGKFSGLHNKISSNSDIEFAKQMAIADAISTAKCDFLVNPLFDIKINGMNIEVTTEGYAAFYTKFVTVKVVPVATEASSSEED